MRAAVIALMLGLACGSTVVDRAEKNSPVTKVVTLLKDMIAQLEKEAKEDDEVYESMMCWCTTGEKDKTKAIADAKVKIQQLIATAEENTALSSQLSNEIATLQTELAENTEALDSATALRQKQLAEFTEEEKDMMSSISGLGKAVGALQKHHGAAFLQVDEASYTQQAMSVMAGLQSIVRRHQGIVQSTFTPRQQKKVMAFVQTSYNPEYKPQSGEIFGLLNTMKESFETNLAQSQSEETTNQDAYTELKKAKEAEISAATDASGQKTQAMAEADQKAAQAKQDQEETENTMAADTEYLANVREKCKDVDAEFAERTKTRQLEIQAVTKALEFLTSDEAHDLVARTLGFAQIAQVSSNHKAAVADKLKKAAASLHDPRLAALAVHVRLDAFGKVKESLQAMVDKLLKEKEDDIAKKDFCVDELNKNLRSTEEETRKKADAEAASNDHQTMADKMVKEIKAHKEEIAEMNRQIKIAGEEREKANKEYQSTVADQRATQKLLSAALNVLKSFYEKTALMQAGAQAQQPAGPPPPPGFKKYEKNAASGGVMGMIQGIIDDAKAMEAEAIKAEEDSMTAYETFIKDTNAAVAELRKQVITKTEIKGKEEQEKVMEDNNAAAAATAYDQLRAENLDLHADCDYLIKNFEVRLEMRDEEVQALKEAISTFSGATFSSFIQAKWER